jgi:hypothetical protein
MVGSYWQPIAVSSNSTTARNIGGLCDGAPHNARLDILVLVAIDIARRSDVLPTNGGNGVL